MNIDKKDLYLYNKSKMAFVFRLTELLFLETLNTS
jgi:hypothetical protein